MPRRGACGATFPACPRCRRSRQARQWAVAPSPGTFPSRTRKPPDHCSMSRRVKRADYAVPTYGSRLPIRTEPSLVPSIRSQWQKTGGHRDRRWPFPLWHNKDQHTTEPHNTAQNFTPYHKITCNTRRNLIQYNRLCNHIRRLLWSPSVLGKSSFGCPWGQSWQAGDGIAPRLLNICPDLAEAWQTSETRWPICGTIWFKLRS